MAMVLVPFFDQDLLGLPMTRVQTPAEWRANKLQDARSFKKIKTPKRKKEITIFQPELYHSAKSCKIPMTARGGKEGMQEYILTCTASPKEHVFKVQELLSGVLGGQDMPGLMIYLYQHVQSFLSFLAAELC